MEKLASLRALFPHTEHLAYLNHAATGPMSSRVVDALHAYIHERHDTLVENYDEFLPVIRETLERAGQVLNVPSRDLAFAPNTSYALNVLAQGLDWQPGDRIIIPGCEFPANVYPFLNLRSKGVEVDFVPHQEGTFSLEDIESLMTPRTRLVAVSWVQFLSGFRADLQALGALCKAKGVLLSVDAIQGIGALQLDVEGLGLDFLACGGHKWMMAAQGIGLMYVEPALREQLTQYAGWLHGPIDWERLTDYKLIFHPDARRYRLGTINSMGIAAMHASLGLYLEQGLEWCETRVLKLAGSLVEGFEERGIRRYGSANPTDASGIVTIHDANPHKTFAAFKENGIHIATRNGLLRFSPTYYNSEAEIEKVLTVMGELQQV